MAVITVNRGFVTETRLMGHFPMHWPINLVRMQLKTKEALPVGSTVLKATTSAVKHIVRILRVWLELLAIEAYAGKIVCISWFHYTSLHFTFVSVLLPEYEYRPLSADVNCAKTWLPALQVLSTVRYPLDGVSIIMVATHQEVQNSLTFRWLFTDLLLMKNNPCLHLL